MPIIGCIIMASCCRHAKTEYPMTKKVDTVDVYFGHQIADPYRWLEDDNSDETAQWVAEQNKLTFSYLDQIPFRKDVQRRLTELFNYPKQTAPIHTAGRFFYFKNDGMQNQNVLYCADSLDGIETELLNPNTMTDDGTAAISTVAVSKDGHNLCYGIASAGSDWSELYVKEIATGKQLPDHLMWTKFTQVAWYGNGFFYSRYPEPEAGNELTSENINNKLYYHNIGTNQADDQLIYEDPQHPQREFAAWITTNNKLMAITAAESTSGNALYIKKLNSSNSPIVNVVDSFESDFFVIDMINGKLLVLTNHQAPKYKLIAIDPDNPAPDKWTDVIPQKDIVLQWVSIKSNHLIASYIRDAQSHIEVYDASGTYLHDITLPQIGSADGFAGDIDDNFTYYTMRTFTSPISIYRYNVTSNHSELYYKPQTSFDSDNYTAKQIFYPSKDGTRIPMFIVHRKDIKLDGNNKVWMYGYGGFNITLTPIFSITRAVWLEQGGIYCQMNLRGGGEYGEDWHKAGTLHNKQNVFDDCIAAAEYMIDKGYTSAVNIVLQGGSNGGLLVGAVVNQRPDLYGVALPAVGVMDMLRYHKFTIGRSWSTDYGTSDDSPDMFRYLLNYSPLHNISTQNYPATLVTTGDHDDRVVPAHSFKYAATLQEKQTGNAPILIRIETNAGHGAGKPTSKWLAENADLLSFSFFNLGLTPKY